MKKYGILANKEKSTMMTIQSNVTTGGKESVILKKS